MAAQHFYVRKSGNDSNGGTSWVDAWLTIQKAGDTANPANGTPITIHIAAGTYAEQIDVDTYAGTDDNNRIIYAGDIANESGDGASRPIVDGENTKTYCFYITKSYIEFRDFEIKRATKVAIQVMDCLSCWVHRCLMHSNGWHGIDFYRASSTNDYHMAWNNIAYNNTYDGLGCNNSCYPTFYNNTVFGNGRWGISLYNTCTYATIKNNIIHDNGTCQINVGSNASKTGFVSDYNCLYRDSGTYVGIWGTNGSYTTLANWQIASGQDANSQEDDPLYVDEAGKDFHITNNASPCYQTGTDLSAVFTDDYDGNTRVHWDIGADYIVTIVTGYTLTAEPGAYSLIGQAVNLLKGYKVLIEVGSYIQSGQIVDLLKTSRIIVGLGSYIQTGQALRLLKGSKITIEAGSYNLIGQVVSLLKESRLILEAGTYDLIGKALALLKANKLIIDIGSYIITGKDVALNRGYIIIADSGQYLGTGRIVNLLKASRIVIATGSYALIGQVINFKHEYIIIWQEIIRKSSPINRILDFDAKIGRTARFDSKGEIKLKSEI